MISSIHYILNYIPSHSNLILIEDLFSIYYYEDKRLLFVPSVAQLLQVRSPYEGKELINSKAFRFRTQEGRKGTSKESDVDVSTVKVHF